MSRPHDPRFQFAVVLVRDQDRSLQFYINQLGFHLVADQAAPSGGCRIVVEPSDRSLLLALVRPPENSAACQRIGLDTGLVLVTSDIAVLYEEWSKRGITFPQAPEETPWKGRTALFRTSMEIDSP